MKEIIILHKSAIIQKGLNNFLFSYRKEVTKIIGDYKNLSFLNNLQRTYLFADVSLDKKLFEHQNSLSVNGNIVVGMSETGEEKLRFPFKEIISYNDTEIKILAKFEKIFIKDENPLRDFCRKPLTVREKEILKLVAKGFSSKDIAKQLFISYHTVITHRKNICNKLGIKTVSGLTLYALVNNIV